ncbi:zinc ribbon domain-containing protein [Amphritea sp.]|uniref:zinc ribbon domain-containing protein n=1 Tax=Amphritea sp. TaxID=1872502 RepID=UPI003A8F42DA
MPTYDYRCETTGEIFTVRHPMALKLSTWADLCDIGGFDEGNTPINAAITKLLNTGGVIRHKTLNDPEAPPCLGSAGCSGHCGS